MYDSNQKDFDSMMEMYRLGTFEIVDIAVAEGDLLQYYYYQKLGGMRPHPLSSAFNFRGYACSHDTIDSYSDVKVVHKAGRERELLGLICPHANSYLSHLRSLTDRGSCRLTSESLTVRCGENTYSPSKMQSIITKKRMEARKRAKEVKLFRASKKNI